MQIAPENNTQNMEASTISVLQQIYVLKPEQIIVKPL